MRVYVHKPGIMQDILRHIAKGYAWYIRLLAERETKRFADQAAWLELRHICRLLAQRLADMTINLAARPAPGESISCRHISQTSSGWAGSTSSQRQPCQGTSLFFQEPPRRWVQAGRRSDCRVGVMTVPRLRQVQP